MRKLISLLFIFIASMVSSQGTLYFQNYSDYDLTTRLFAANEQQCFPTVFTTLTFPAHTLEQYDNFNQSFNAINVPVDVWNVRTSSTGTIVPQMNPSPLLNIMSSQTRWQFCTFQTRIAGTGASAGDQDFELGDVQFSASCGLVTYDVLIGNSTLTEALWFYLQTTNETYLLVQ